MSTTYGLTLAGFVAKPQSVIKTELEDSFKAVFGQNINLSANSNFGQFVGIMSEREALVWQLIEAVYASQYPGGAEGTSVDNILALNNLKRKLATPSKTDPTPITKSNGVTEYGLVLYGTAGTTILAGSLVQTNQSPPLQFSLDSAVTIGPALDAVQSIFFSNTPDVGSFSVSIEDVNGNTLTTPLVPYNALSAVTKLNFSGVPITGNFSLTLTQAGAPLTTALIPYTANAAAVQSAITVLTGYSGVTVAGSFASGFQITWGLIANPVVTFATNTLGVTASVIDSVQSAFNNLLDVPQTQYPYTDVVVSPNASGYNVTFGSGTVVAGQPVSSNQPQPLLLLVSNTLQMGVTVTNVNIENAQEGAPARGFGSATCLVTGPNFVSAGSLNTIGTSVSGWTGVNNELDCLTGTNVETDTEALARRQLELESNANGPLQSIIEKVTNVIGVTACIGFENLNESALQILSFASIPSMGSYKLIIAGVLTATIVYNADAVAIQAIINAIPGLSAVLVTGNFDVGFTIDFNGAYGGQAQPLTVVTSNTTGVVITPSFGRPGKSFEIVALGGTNSNIAETIFGSKPAGIQTYGSVTQQVFDNKGNPYNISFSRPTPVPVYVAIVLQTDLTDSKPKFNRGSISLIQQDIVTLGNAFGIGGLIIGFGSNGLIGAFNAVPGIKSYTLFFGRNPNPVSNANIQLQPEESPDFQTFLVSVSYT